MRSLLDAQLARVAELHPRSIDLSLGRIRRLLQRLGDPERELGTVVHVAGTNGKGSVIAMLAAVLREGGVSANAYVSPHLLRFNERILINGYPIEDAQLGEALAMAEHVNAGAPITFFEITTAAALLAFRARPADVTLLETGLGGRLDATNVVSQPALTVITPVGLDHCDRLGSKLSQIAAEKAGILKEGVPVVVGRQEPEAQRVISRRAREMRAPLLRQGVEWHLERHGGRAFYVDPSGERRSLSPALVGDHQQDNAGTVMACLAAMPGFAISHATAARAMANVRWPGRLQRLWKGRLARLAAPSELWVDAGHNPDAAQVLAAWGGAGAPFRLVVGLHQSKDAAQFFAAFRDVAEYVATVPLGLSEAGWSPDNLTEEAHGAGLRVRPYGSLEEAVRGISKLTPPGKILIAGSFLLAGRAFELSEARESQIRL